MKKPPVEPVTVDVVETVEKDPTVEMVQGETVIEVPTLGSLPNPLGPPIVEAEEEEPNEPNEPNHRVNRKHQRRISVGRIPFCQDRV